MVTLKNLYTAFGHDPKWGRLATQSAQPMVSVFMRKLGDTDITTLTDFDIEMQLAMSEQPEDRKVKARSCMHYLLRWAREQGKEVPQIAHPFGMKKYETKETIGNDNSDKRQEIANVDHHNDRQRRIPPPSKPHKAATRKAKPVDKKRTDPKPKPRSTARRKSDKDIIKPDRPIVTKTCKEPIELDRKGKKGAKCRGTIYNDTASKGDIRAGKRRAKGCWRAEITINGQRYRHRSKDREDCERWLKAVRTGKIKPTDNKADWWRMEQHKDEAVRIDEIIVNAAEESVMLYDYHQTGDLTAINDYIVKRLLPHMAYYCAHTLNFGKDRTITASRQAIALLLTRITAGKPVMNFTATCKRMLRVHKQRGDFFYYEKAPEQVRIMVNGMNLDGLTELYKVTKDRRI